MKDDKFILILSTYVDSVFQDFGSFLRTQIDLVEDDVRLVPDEYNSSFIIYELEPGIYTFKDLSEALFNSIPARNGYHNAIDFEYDDITMRTKLVVIPKVIAIGLMKIRFLILS